MGNQPLCQQCSSFDSHHLPSSASASARQRQPILYHSPAESAASGTPLPPPAPTASIVALLDNGKVQISYANGMLYEGELEDSLRGGAGKMTWPSGSCFQGRWLRDLPQGEGLFFDSRSGSTYLGSFKSDCLAAGKCIGKDSEFEYEGQLRGNAFEGRGRLSVKGSYTYEGGFEGGLPSGQGQLTLPRGESFEG
jgi:hypothetical protein